MLRTSALMLLVLCLLIPLFHTHAGAADLSLEKQLHHAFTRSQSVVGEMQVKLKKGTSIGAELSELKSLASAIREKHLLLEERFQKRQNEIADLGAKAITRHSEVVKHYQELMGEYLRIIDSLEMVEDVSPTVLNEIKVLLERVLPQKKKLILGALPYTHLNYAGREPSREPVVTPAYRGGAKEVTPDDLRGTPEAPISFEIATLAQSLSWNPVSIYEWVKNTIETEWYFGSMKGAEETLRQRSGNDCDQSALLVALLRASGFPARYVRGVIEFFPDIGRAKHLIGIEDEKKLAAFFQKAGIPYTPVISGGKITNFQLEHLWVEAEIPYANYRGVVIDDRGKVWLGLDTSIKVRGYTYSEPEDIGEEINLSAVREEYVERVREETPLEYFKKEIEAYLTQHQPDTTYAQLLQTRALIKEELQILPASMQFKQVAITHEYTELPAELMHKAEFIAMRLTNTKLFDSTLEVMKLSNRQVVVGYEPETVEDQEIINSYGGLGNTPSYLVHLRPVLKVGGERVAVGIGGMAVGEEYTLTMKLISPNGVEQVQNTLITGNQVVVGLAAQGAVELDELALEEKDAARLLQEEAVHFINRWNETEKELASLLKLTITRPIPTVVTLGSVVEVTWLCDAPQGFEWKGVYVDADLKAVEVVAGHALPSTIHDSRQLFMELSGLQGSILENRVLEDDFKVESISTAKLMALANTNGISLLTIDHNNLDDILPTLPFADTIKEDIANAVNQHLAIRIPNSEIVYEDWTGIGYIKEDGKTGESGWMLSGEIAGSMTAWSDDRWPAYYQERLENPDVESANYDPLSAVSIQKIASRDMQTGTVGKKLLSQLQVLVRDKNMKPVAGAEVVFTVKAGGGMFKKADGTTTNMLTVTTNARGIAGAEFILGKKTADNPYMWWKGYEYPMQVGENCIDARLASGISIKGPFVAYGFPEGVLAEDPDAPKDKKRWNMIKTKGEGKYGYILSSAGYIEVRIEDECGNPISDVPVEFSSGQSTPSTDGRQALLVHGNDPCMQDVPVHGQCGSPSLTQKSSVKGSSVQVILGGTPAAAYPIMAKIAEDKSETFTLYTFDAEKSRELVLLAVHETDWQAGKVGTDIVLKAKCYWLVKGDEGQYNVDFNFTGKIMFGDQEGRGIGNGIYEAQYRLAGEPKLNSIELKALVNNNLEAMVRMHAYGVDIVTVVEKFIFVDEEGYAVGDNKINYEIKPLDYQAATAYVAIYEDTNAIAYIPTENQGRGFATISEGFRFDIEADHIYEAKVILNRGTGVEVGSGKIPLKLARFRIVEPRKGTKIVISNDSGGEPRMPELEAKVGVEGKGVDSGMLNDLKIYWKTKVEYSVNVPAPNSGRSRKGLECNAEGICTGTDGFFIPNQTSPDPGKFENWIEAIGPNHSIDWGEKFGGGVLEITAKAIIDEVEVSDTYEGKIEGEMLNDTFKRQIIDYLVNPQGDQENPTIREQVDCNVFFRIIAYLETRYWHFSKSVLGEPKDAIYPTENITKKDGGYGIMQLTDPKPEYKQIWNYRLNIDDGIELIRGKLQDAKAYPAKVRNAGCEKPPVYNPDGTVKYYRCRPEQKQDKDAKDFNPFQLKMDTYSLYNSNWHYWKWDIWKSYWFPRREPFPKKEVDPSYYKTGSYYADKADDVEKNPGNYIGY